jgi:archaellum component FlaC
MEESLPPDTQERFGRIESRLDVLSADVAQIKTDVAGLKTDVAGLKTDVAGLRTDVAGLRTGLSDLGHQMRVLHEDTIDRIKTLAPDFGPIRREYQQADKDLRSEMNSRLVILEAAVRQREPPAGA